MARHETEMHRQRRELIAALKVAREGFGLIANSHTDRLIKQMASHHFQQCQAALKAVQPPCDEGLFADHRQLDLADRKDVP